MEPQFCLIQQNICEVLRMRGMKKTGNSIMTRGEEITGAVAKGIDVSKWNGDIDWAKVKATDVDYAIIRCGYGDDETSQDDPYWKTNADACTKEGIPFGTYIYSYADSVTAAKAKPIMYFV